MIRKLFGPFAAFILVMVGRSSAATPDAREILAKVADSYAKLKTYDPTLRRHFG